MDMDIKVGGRHLKNDPRDLRNWVGSLTLKATVNGDQFLLAAIYRVLTNKSYEDESTSELRNLLKEEAKKCMDDHKKVVERMES